MAAYSSRSLLVCICCTVRQYDADASSPPKIQLSKTIFNNTILFTSK